MKKKFTPTITLNCLNCNFDQTVVKATLWRRILLKLGFTLIEYCPYCDKMTQHVELDFDFYPEDE